jgi:hypothetical protein
MGMVIAEDVFGDWVVGGEDSTLEAVKCMYVCNRVR